MCVLALPFLLKFVVMIIRDIKTLSSLLHNLVVSKLANKLTTANSTPFARLQS